MQNITNTTEMNILLELNQCNRYVSAFKVLYQCGVFRVRPSYHTTTPHYTT